ncbi:MULTISPECIES: hypothetical protein [unclassified Streptomyces]|uniref:hypothetical protein n=1 Tax=unclassified Streptomyces TaxID=2593676 RepID=UPI0033245BD2
MAAPPVDTEVLWWEAAEEVAASAGHRPGAADAPEVGRAVQDTAAHLMRVARPGPGMSLSATDASEALTRSVHRRVGRGGSAAPPESVDC